MLPPNKLPLILSNAHYIPSTEATHKVKQGQRGTTNTLKWKFPRATFDTSSVGSS